LERDVARTFGVIEAPGGVFLDDDRLCEVFDRFVHLHHSPPCGFIKGARLHSYCMERRLAWRSASGELCFPGVGTRLGEGYRGAECGMEDTLASDLVAMWQSELTAMAADREVRESWVTLLGLWAQSVTTAAALLSHDTAPGSAHAAQPA